MLAQRSRASKVAIIALLMRGIELLSIIDTAQFVRRNSLSAPQGDGVDLTPRIRAQRLEAICFLNIPSHGAGTNPWGTPPSRDPVSMGLNGLVSKGLINAVLSVRSVRDEHEWLGVKIL